MKRRDFLKILGIGTAASAVGAKAVEQPVNALLAPGDVQPDWQPTMPGPLVDSSTSVAQGLKKPYEAPLLRRGTAPTVTIDGRQFRLRSMTGPTHDILDMTSADDPHPVFGPGMFNREVSLEVYLSDDDVDHFSSMFQPKHKPLWSPMDWRKFEVDDDYRTVMKFRGRVTNSGVNVMWGDLSVELDGQMIQWRKASSHHVCLCDRLNVNGSPKHVRHCRFQQRRSAVRVRILNEFPLNGFARPGAMRWYSKRWAWELVRNGKAEYVEKA